MRTTTTAAGRAAAGRNVSRAVLIRPAAVIAKFASASLVLSLVGLSLLGVIFGHVANGQIAKKGEGGSGIAAAVPVIGYLTMIVIVFRLLSS